MMTKHYNEGGMLPEINIKKSKRGELTRKAKRAGFKDATSFARHVLANKDKYSKETRKQAQFAVNASMWNK